jgi:thymidylate synthase (FAD)
MTQIMRHRTANVNEYSARYSIVKERFFVPQVDDVRKQCSVYKQSGVDQCEEKISQDFVDCVSKVNQECFDKYNYFIQNGI